jgi:hypothetical protein
MKAIHIVSLMVVCASLLVGTIAAAAHTNVLAKDGGVTYATGDSGKVELAADGGK